MRRLNRGLVRVLIEGSVFPSGEQCLHITIYSRTRRKRTSGSAALCYDELGNRAEFRSLLRQARAEWRRSILGADWQERKAQKAAVEQLYPAMSSEAIRIAHASLERWSEDSAFKAHCPRCQPGLLLVARNQRTLRIQREDRCISCAQRFIYTDNEIGGEALPLETE